MPPAYVARTDWRVAAVGSAHLITGLDNNALICLTSSLLDKCDSTTASSPTTSVGLVAV